MTPIPQQNRTYLYLSQVPDESAQRLEVIDAIGFEVQEDGGHRVALAGGAQSLMPAGWAAIELQAQAWSTTDRDGGAPQMDVVPLCNERYRLADNGREVFLNIDRVVERKTSAASGTTYLTCENGRRLIVSPQATLVESTPVAPARPRLG